VRTAGVRRSHTIPFGSELREDGRIRFRLWAPAADTVEVCLTEGINERLRLSKLEEGWFELVTDAAGPGTRYAYRIDDRLTVPDPASRFQPCDVNEPSEVVDPRGFEWNDDGWHGRRWEDAMIYELHVGTFTQEGTFRAVERKLDYLHELGVTALELMPVADFAGKRNWGYDGVLLYAPDSAYGRPEDLKRLVQAAHAREMMIFLDVVYNHFGPEGNYLPIYAPQFFTNRHNTPWGDAINFDGPESRVVRDFFIHNALYWLEEYRFDGLRFDAVHAIVDESKPDILTELALRVRESFENERLVHLILENGDNAARYLRRNQDMYVQYYDAQWNDDIHHALHVLVTGETDGYYSDYASHPMERLGRCLTEGFAFQGEYSQFHKSKRGEPSVGLPPSAFISFLQNHDQVGNRAFGERILQLAPPEAVRAAMEILLLTPEPPLLFMGEEFGAASPFLFFCDFHGDLAAAVTNGRRNEFARFAQFSSAATRSRIPDPNAEETFLRSKLDWDSLRTEVHQVWLQLYRELLAIRARTIVPLLPLMRGGRARFRQWQNHGLAVEWELTDGTLLCVLANLGSDSLITPRWQQHEIQLYCSSHVGNAFENNQLPPWSVLWFRDFKQPGIVGIGPVPEHADTA
jgi:maltooligosyltrehalose trehalohydrolase